MVRTIIYAFVAGLTPLGCGSPGPAPADQPPQPATGLPVAEAALAGCPPSASTPFADPLVHLARAEGDAFIEILDAHHRDGRIFACTGTQGLTVWSTADDGTTALLAEGIAPRDAAHAKFPRCQHVALHDSDSRVVLTSRGDEVQPRPFVGVVDLESLDAPKTLAVHRGDASYEGAVFVDDDVVVAAHQAGLMRLTVDGARLTPRATFRDAHSDAWFPALSPGGDIVVAEGATGLRTYSVADHGIALLATLALPGSSKHLAIEGTTAYVATSTGIAIVDIADPAAPQLLSTTQTPGTALAVAVGRPGALFVADWDQVRGYAVDDPRRPVAILGETIPTEGSFSRVLALAASRDGRVFAGEWQGMHVLRHVESAPSPELEIHTTTVAMGRAGTGKPALAELRLRNSGDAPLTISRIERTDSAVSVTPTCLQLQPGQSKAVDVRLEPDDEQPFAGQLVLHTDDPDEPRVTVGVVANTAGANIGDDAPDFDALDLNGKRWTKAGLTGKVVLLAYFATF